MLDTNELENQKITFHSCELIIISRLSTISLPFLAKLILNSLLLLSPIFTNPAALAVNKVCCPSGRSKFTSLNLSGGSQPPMTPPLGD